MSFSDLPAYCKGIFTTAQWLDIKKWPKGLCLCVCFEVYWIRQVRAKGLKVVTCEAHALSLSLLPVLLICIRSRV